MLPGQAVATQIDQRPVGRRRQAGREGRRQDGSVDGPRLQSRQALILATDLDQRDPVPRRIEPELAEGQARRHVPGPAQGRDSDLPALQAFGVSDRRRRHEPVGEPVGEVRDRDQVGAPTHRADHLGERHGGERVVAAQQRRGGQGTAPDPPQVRLDPVGLEGTCGLHRDPQGHAGRVQGALPDRDPRLGDGGARPSEEGQHRERHQPPGDGRGGAQESGAARGLPRGLRHPHQRPGHEYPGHAGLHHHPRASRPDARKIVVTVYGEGNRLAARLSPAVNPRHVDRRYYVPSPAGGL